MTNPDEVSLVEKPESTNRICTICTATVAAFKDAMCCHCETMPWAIDPDARPEAATPLVKMREALLQIAKCENDDFAGNPAKWSCMIARKALGFPLQHAEFLAALSSNLDPSGEE